MDSGDGVRNELKCLICGGVAAVVALLDFHDPVQFERDLLVVVAEDSQ